MGNIDDIDLDQPWDNLTDSEKKRVQDEVCRVAVADARKELDEGIERLRKKYDLPPRPTA